MSRKSLSNIISMAMPRESINTKTALTLKLGPVDVLLRSQIDVDRNHYFNAKSIVSTRLHVDRCGGRFAKALILLMSVQIKAQKVFSVYSP